MMCPVLSLWAKCSCHGGVICGYCMQLTLSVIAMALGAFSAVKPGKTIRIQGALYRFFNWKLEPIDLEKQIRNIRLRGLAALCLGIISMACLIAR
ncbi:MAG: hypothetical protein WCG78_07355 [Candidatus Omnitrophota bacterium]